jgi:DNA-binding IscR family transcriptional regulator
LTALAFSPEEVIGSQTLAASVNTNPVVVRRLLLALRRARLIETFTGKHGGARLRKRPNDISLADIYDAVESPPGDSRQRPESVKAVPRELQYEEHHEPRGREH